MQAITPEIFGVLGSKISYSLSPQIFSILFDRFKLPHGYFLFDIGTKALPEFIESAKLLGVAGFNVTVPFKCEIIPYLDKIHSLAKQSRAVNLVIMRKGKLTGYNTDIFGMMESFSESGISSFAGKRTLIIGAGGTARTALAYLLSQACSEISIVNRSRKHLKEMLFEFGLANDSKKIETYQLVGLKKKLKSQRWDIIFNATPLVTERILPGAVMAPGSVIFEAVYRHGNRKLPRKVKLLGGVDMLIFQALKGFEIFTGVGIEDYRRMKRIVKRRLRTAGRTL